MGASGFLGWNLCKEASGKFEVMGSYFKNSLEIDGVRTLKLDITDMSSVEKRLKELSPYAVINTVALASAGYCEKHREKSEKINKIAPVKLAELCSKQDITYLFTSTDLVFDGQNAPYSEMHESSPISIYGTHKAEAEELILKVNTKAKICRMPLMFGLPSPVSGTFIQDIIEKNKRGEKCNLFTDEYRTPIGGKSAAKGLLKALNFPGGIYNMGGKKIVSRYDFGIILSKIYNLDKNLIIPSLQKEIKTLPARPKDVSLNSSKAFTLGYSPLSINKELEEIKNG